MAYMYRRRNIPLRADKLPIPHNNVVGENPVIQLNIVETTLHVCVCAIKDLAMGLLLR